MRRHLDRYLQLVFPGAKLDLDLTMAPGAMVRQGPEGLEAHTFDALSFGAREQLGVLTRLAYADLVKEAGRPTLLILDDALVHNDSDHIDRMKRAIFDAAARHQVLLFICHPEVWRDMGVAIRRLEALKDEGPVRATAAESA